MYKIILSTLVSLTLYAQSSITPIPKTLSYNQDQAHLGKKLFEDVTLFKNGSISCSSCHNLQTNGASSSQYSFGVDSKETLYNASTVFNSVFNFVYFYDGRAKNPQEQTRLAIEDHSHMNIKVRELADKLKTTKYKEEFEKAFEDGLNEENIINALVEFQKALITPNSKFDVYLRGDTTVLNTQEKQGYKEFVKDGCINCHNGINVGSNMYQKMGVFTPYSADKISHGRSDITKRDRDKFVYKVPTLRNIAQTAPYFHDGAAATLEDAVVQMYELQLGVKKSKKDVQNIVAFLKTLSGDKPKILEGEK